MKNKDEEDEEYKEIEVGKKCILLYKAEGKILTLIYKAGYDDSNTIFKSIEKIVKKLSKEIHYREEIIYAIIFDALRQHVSTFHWSEEKQKTMTRRRLRNLTDPLISFIRYRKEEQKETNRSTLKDLIRFLLWRAPEERKAWQEEH